VSEHSDFITLKMKLRVFKKAFSHNQVNPDDHKNRILQIGSLPEIKWQSATYKSYTPKFAGVTRIYGGPKNQSETFDSHTIIDIVHLNTGKSISLDCEQLSYRITGEATISEHQNTKNSGIIHVKDSDLIRSIDTKIMANASLQLLVVSQQAY
jgi:hypothetical protein